MVERFAGDYQNDRVRDKEVETGAEESDIDENGEVAAYFVTSYRNVSLCTDVHICD